MKLTPRCLGRTFGHKDWRPEKTIKISLVTRGFTKMVEGTGPQGEILRITTTEDDNGWFEIPLKVSPD